jgi:hypothetical protein
VKWHGWHLLIAREVLEGEIIPTGYRIAWWDWSRNVSHAYPIGLHLVVALGRRLWEWSYRIVQPTALEQRIRRERHEAYEEGHRAGYAAAFQRIERDLERRARYRDQ